jgi:dTDP-4-amino-4,6-dideoxygalactose transaminase
MFTGTAITDNIETPSWRSVDLFEKKIADFFGSPYGIATDCVTHALELSLRLTNCPKEIVTIPKHTYMSVPMMLEKIQQPWKFIDLKWSHYYYLHPFDIIDAATLWRHNSYIPGTLMCISFQHKKHLPIGRGGIILTDNLDHYDRLQRLVRDGRNRILDQTQDDVTEIGYHYYMTPEDAVRGISMFDSVKNISPKVFSDQNYFDLTRLSVFKHASHG